MNTALISMEKLTQCAYCDKAPICCKKTRCMEIIAKFYEVTTPEERLIFGTPTCKYYEMKG